MPAVAAPFSRIERAERAPQLVSYLSSGSYHCHFPHRHRPYAVHPHPLGYSTRHPIETTRNRIDPDGFPSPIPKIEWIYVFLVSN